jgi:FemAB-related protein (PEP-CTERM system-associated)
MKKPHIRPATDSDQISWDNYVLMHPKGTAYQLFAWGKAVEHAYGFQRIYLIAENESKVCGVFPAIHFRVPLIGTRLISLPYCDAGGLLADVDEIAQDLWRQMVAIAKERRCSCKIRSGFSLPFAGENRTDKVRMVLDLPETSEQLMDGFKSKLRSQIRKPLRDGLNAKIGNGELVEDFYEVFVKNMRDLGSPVHSRQWIEAVIDDYGERARIAVVYTSGGIPAAAGIILLHSQTVVIPWASALRCFNHLNANMLLYWTLLAFAADNGFTRFDFGRSTPGEGTWRFKEQWGAAPQPLFWYEAGTRAKSCAREQGNSLSARRRHLAAALWSMLPAAGTRRLGPWIRKYISL